MVGECHSDTNIKFLLMDSMKHFYDQGVRTLYMEMLYKKNQGVINKYYKGSVSDEAVISAMNEYRGGKKRWQNPEDSTYDLSKLYMGIIEAAKRHGIRVVAIDKDVRNNNANQRFVGRNIEWANTIFEDSRLNEGKGIIYGGAFHIGKVNNENENRCDEDTTGVDGRLSELLSKEEGKVVAIHGSLEPENEEDENLSIDDIKVEGPIIKIPAYSACSTTGKRYKRSKGLAVANEPGLPTSLSFFQRVFGSSKGGGDQALARS